MTLMGIVHNFAGLAAARFFLGLAESGLFPGICKFRNGASAPSLESVSY